MWTLLPYSKIVNKNTLKFESWSSESERQGYLSIWEKEKEIYKELTADNVIEKYEAKLEKKRNELTQVFEAEKKKLSEKLTAKLKELEDIRKADVAAAEKQESIAKKEKAMELAAKHGPLLSKVINTDKEALKGISKEIEIWAKQFYSILNLDKLEKSYPNGYLKETYMDALKIKLMEISREGHKSQKENLVATFDKNPFFKKIQTWVGAEMAKQWYDDLKKKE
jgi:hypothetical protein